MRPAATSSALHDIDEVSTTVGGESACVESSVCSTLAEDLQRLHISQSSDEQLFDEHCTSYDHLKPVQVDAACQTEDMSGFSVMLKNRVKCGFCGFRYNDVSDEQCCSCGQDVKKWRDWCSSEGEADSIGKIIEESGSSNGLDSEDEDDDDSCDDDGGGISSGGAEESAGNFITIEGEVAEWEDEVKIIRLNFEEFEEATGIRPSRDLFTVIDKEASVVWVASKDA